MNKKQIRKMQTAAGGPLRIKFTPEQIAQFKSQATRILGINNSGGNRYREEGIQAQQHQEQEAKRKEEEIKSRMEMRPTLKRKVTTSEKLRGKKDEYEQKPQIVGMSGADPLLSFYVGGVGLNGIGALAKTGLWNIAKYAPTTQLGNWSRGYFVGNTFKNSFNGSVPTLTSQTTSLLYQPAKQNESGLTSLKFFERKPSKLTEAERKGIPKGERNQPFKQKQLIEHVQGDEAIKMFKEYGGEPIPENSYLGKQLQEYIKEARVRYGLENDSRITDKQIAEALYKEIKEQTGLAKDFDTNEPIIGFRGDTQRYTQLKERPSPEKLSTMGGTMDNSLGNLFLGEWPEGKRGLGIDRYIVTARPEQHFAFQDRIVSNPSGSGTGATFKNIKSEFPSFEELFKQGYFQYPIKEQLTRRGTSLGLVYKVKPEYTTTGVNDINAFMFKGVPRESSFEIQVGNQGRAAGQLNNFNLMTEEKPVLNVNDPENLTYNWKGKEINILDDSGSETGVTRELMKEHYTNLLKDAENKNQGLLVSGYAESGTGKVHPFRDEHGHYTYIALPNFNIQGAKHLLPYDLRIKRNWKDKNIYRTLVPIAGSYTLYNLLNNQNNQKLEYRKQGGKMNILEFLKKGSGIHIKKKNRGKFTSYCGGKVTDECIRKAKASGNPTLVKRATFADNARHFKHKKGGKAFVNEVNVLDSNPKMSKASSKKVKKHQYGGNVDNSNANGGIAFKIWLDNQLKLPGILKQKEEVEKEKLQQKLIENQKQTERYGNIAQSILGIGQKYLGNLLNNKSAKVDNGSPSSTINFWNTPTIKNAQVTGDFWNTPTIANSLA